MGKNHEHKASWVPLNVCGPRGSIIGGLVARLLKPHQQKWVK